MDGNVEINIWIECESGNKWINNVYKSMDSVEINIE
jgi:hypothetical protein